jgi:hypothetical protein
MPPKKTTIKIAETSCKLPSKVNTFDEVVRYGKSHPECKVTTKSFTSTKQLDTYLKKKK